MIFQRTEEQSTPDFNSIIKRSLERSVQYGVDPNRLKAPKATRLSSSQLSQKIMEQHEFYSVARKVLDSLYGLLKGTGFCITLADKDGYVLYVIGDSDIIEHFKNRHCIPGYRWTEKDMGTCAIGLILEERIPIFIPGDNMFTALSHKTSNAAGPVFSPDGRELLGVICLSGHSEKMHIHTLGLVRQSAETVTGHLRESAHVRELDIQNQYMNALLESNSQGMITVDRRGCIVQTNQRARSLLNLPVSINGRPFAECVGEGFNISNYLKDGKGFRARELLTKKSGKTHFASLNPIRLNTDELVGGLITVFEKEEMILVAAEMVGSHAHFTFDSIVGTSDKLQSAIKMARISAGNSTTVLLSGETGTGKELFAQAIHNASDRRKHPFVAINCGAIPKELLESELFGYEEGSFTGAKQGGRPGKLELANNGTLFLDEIGDMPLDMQVKLLRVLQSGEIQRVGGLRSVPVNLRIISATNANLKQAIQDRKFRDDLYYRICTLKIEIPPLRKRRDDILLLANHFIKRHESQLHRKITIKKPESEHFLMQYNWPGNIRQLESAIERAIHLTEGEVLMPENFGISDFHSSQSDNYLNNNDPNNPETLAEIEKKVILNTLTRFDGNICKAAQSLGISRQTIYRKLKKSQ